MKEKESEWLIEGLIKKNKVNMMNVSHDDHCELLKDKSKECNCNPDISVDVIEDK